jgi:hypothetical protein
VSDTVEFGGWPRPPRWVWALAGAAAVAVLAGVVVARTGPHRTAASSRPKPAPVPSSRAPGSAVRWPSAGGACGLPVFLPQIHLARRHARVPVRVLVGGAALRQVTGGAVSRPLPGLPGHGRLVTTLVAGPGAGYAFDVPCSSSSASARVYRVVAGGAHPLGITAEALLGGPRQAWAVTYLPGAVLTQVLTPLNGGRAVTLKSNITLVAGAAAGLVAVVYHPPAGRRVTVELVDPNTGAVLRRLGEGAALGAVGHVALVSLPDCGAPLAASTCTLESIDLTTGRPTAAFELPAGRVPVSDAVFSPDGTEAAFQLARARLDPRFTTELGLPPSDVAVLHLQTGSLDLVPGLKLPPETQTGLAFDATGYWLLATVSEGSRGELLAWRPGMPGPALVTSLPGPLAGPPPLLPAPSSSRNG